MSDRLGGLSQRSCRQAIPLSNSMEALTGADPREVGEYQLLGRLGSGGMGRVFLAVSPSGRMVAVKVIRPELAEDPKFIRRFQDEVDAALRVSGFYTAPVVAAGTDEELPWLATAFVPGPSLDEVTTMHGPRVIDFGVARGRRHPADRDRVGRRDAQLHVSRAGGRAAGRPGERYFSPSGACSPSRRAGYPRSVPDRARRAPRRCTGSSTASLTWRGSPEASANSSPASFPTATCHSTPLSWYSASRTCP